MKSVLISIKPKWCKLISSKKKTVEVRKTKPKLETPFKVYIYETKMPLRWNKAHNNIIGGEGGRVIGEFVCDDICEHRAYKWREGGFEGLNYKYNSDLSRESCVSQDELMKYSNRKPLYGWHISDLVIYDKPMELSKFYAEGDCDCMNCKKCAWFDCGNGYNVESDCNLAYKGVEMHKSYKPIIRPPQSWCYVDTEEKE